MSASTERKIRQANREAGTDKKMIAAQEEAAKKAKSKRRWIIGTIAVVLFIAVVLLLDSSLLYTSTTAVDISGTRYSPAQVSYLYTNQYFNFANQYGDYASIFGLDTSAGTAGLRSQDCPMTEDGTWRDYFLDSAISELTQTQALCDYASANGIALTDEETVEVDQGLSNLDLYASMYGFPNGSKYLSANYGVGVNTKLVRQLSLDSALASKAYTEKSSSFQYTDAELEEKYTSYEGAKDTYSYATCFISASESSGVTLDQAKAKAEDVVAAYKEGTEEDAYARFEAAAAKFDIASSRTMNSADSLTDAYADWMTGSRTEGDIEIFENSGSTGCYVVLFLSSSDNHYKTAQVRHILIKAVADENGVYTDEAKAAAKATAEDILKTWQAGEATEDSFAALANQFSEDAGSNTNGGLYDTVVKGQMVEEFDKFCFEGHKAGDTGIVYGESGAYAGYHVMYYVGEGELYSNIIARNDLLSTDMNAWFESLIEPYEAKNGFGLKLVG